MTAMITLQQIRDKSPCREGWTKLLKYLGNPSDMSIAVSIGDIAKSNGAADALWCTRCLPESECRNIIRCILPAVERASVHASDKRVSDSIEAVKRWLDGDDTVDLRAAAAYAFGHTAAADAADAASAAAHAAAAAAYAFGHTAAADAADAAYAASAAAHAASAAAAAAAYAAAAAAAAAAAERAKQVEDIIAIYPVTK